jgi:hypothetical protein
MGEWVDATAAGTQEPAVFNPGGRFSVFWWNWIETPMSGGMTAREKMASEE